MGFEMVSKSIPHATIDVVDAAQVIRRARTEATMSLRELAVRADTSHSAIAAYESGRTVPTAAVLDRIVRAAGFALDVSLAPRAHRHHDDPGARGRELVEVLELAAQFPALHEPEMAMPRFGPV